MRIFASFPHSHTVGKAITTTLIRNGTAIADVIKNDNYDFDYQVCHFLMIFISSFLLFKHSSQLIKVQTVVLQHQSTAHFQKLGYAICNIGTYLRIPLFHRFEE